MTYREGILWRLSLHKVSKIPTKSCTVQNWNILFMAIKKIHFSAIYAADRNMLMLAISHISSIQCHISNTPRGFSAISGMWQGSRFLALQREEVHPTSAMLPGMIAYRKTAAYIVPDLCARETVFPKHLLHLGLCSSCTLPTLFVRRDTSRLSQKQSVAKGNLAPWQLLGRFSELLQQLWPGLEALWFWRGLEGIYSSYHISSGTALISRVLSCWRGWLDSMASCFCLTCAGYFPCTEKSLCIMVVACHNYKHCHSVVTSSFANVIGHIWQVTLVACTS